MTRERRHFTPEQKVALLCLHLLEKKPVSPCCSCLAAGLGPACVSRRSETGG